MEAAVLTFVIVTGLVLMVAGKAAEIRARAKRRLASEQKSADCGKMEG